MARVKIFNGDGKLVDKPIETVKKLPKHQKEAMETFIEKLPEVGERGALIRGLLNTNLQWFKQKPCKSDEDVAQRLNDYFSVCGDIGELPTIESMCLCLGINKNILKNWENGVNISKARSSMINKAKELIASIDTQLVVDGKMPQLVYMFRAKNFYGMTDKTDLNITTTNKLDDYDEEEIKQYIEDTIIIDAD